MNEQAALTGVRKAAILLVSLGEEVASAVYRHLPDTDLQRITREIAELDYVPAELAGRVLQEYQRLSVTQDCIAQGGAGFANKVLVKAFGEDGARQLLDDVARAQEITASNLDSLRSSDPQQLAKFLENEHPQTIALILAHLEARQASSLLLLLPTELRADTVKRLAGMRQFSPEMAQRISGVLHRRMEALGEQSRRAYAGCKGVAELLNRMEPGPAQEILERIEQQDADVALGIRNQMFTFEDFLTVSDNDLRELMAHVDRKVVAMALRGGSEEMKNRVYKTMSSRAVEMMKEDIDALGPVRSREVSKAQQEVVATARKLEAEGKLNLKADSEDEYIV